MSLSRRVTFLPLTASPTRNRKMAIFRGRLLIALVAILLLTAEVSAARQGKFGNKKRKPAQHAVLVWRKSRDRFIFWFFFFFEGGQQGVTREDLSIPKKVSVLHDGAPSSLLRCSSHLAHPHGCSLLVASPPRTLLHVHVYDLYRQSMHHVYTT